MENTKEKLQIKRSLININDENIGYIFIPIEIKDGNIIIETDTDNIIKIGKGEDINSNVWLKNKLGIIVELID
jgi:hypothetical protein